MVNWPPLLKPERRPNMLVIITLKENNTGMLNIKIQKEIEKSIPGTH